MRTGARHGIALRPAHFRTFLSREPRADWVELPTEAFMGAHGRPRLDTLDELRREVPVVLHGTTLSIGSVDPLDDEYLASLKALVERTQPAWVSDHLAWCSFGQRPLDLLPLPYNEESLAHVASRVAHVQDTVRAPLLLENPSSCVTFAESTLPEWEFLGELCARTGCGILLDVNNLYLTAHNNGFSASAYLRGLPADRVLQLHLGNNRVAGDLLVDTGDGPVAEPVWTLYREVLETVGSVSTIVEWEHGGPTLDALLAERDRAAAIAAEVLA